MDTEEMIRAQPMDSVVVIGGCDKTLPAQIMAAVSADLPTVVIPVGPMVVGHHKGEVLGACTDCRRLWGKYRAGEIDDVEIEAVNGRLAPSVGTCMVMGTASTMACIAETLGMSLPGSAAIPAAHADRLRAAEATGNLAVHLARKPRTPKEVITPEAVENALRVLLALGGSTNAIIHLTAIAGRMGIEVPLQRLNALSDDTPVLVDLKPTGQHYMEDFFAGGGVGAVLRELAPKLNLDCVGVTGETLGARIEAERDAYVNRDVIKSADHPIEPVGGLIALFGSLAPRGAILKRSAADKSLFEREGRAVVFSSLEDLSERVDDPDLDVAPDDILVLQNAGPTSDSGMPEAGYLPIPTKLGRSGVKDMIRISDARMSGTAFGTIVLHVTPEAAQGGPLALVRTGDRIRLSVRDKRLDLMVEESELARRRNGAPQRRVADGPKRGYAKLYRDTVLQADQGCDFDFLRAENFLGAAESLKPAAARTRSTGDKESVR
jgi:dihydroxy-acid dehydratase